MQVSKDDIRLFLYKPNKDSLGEIRTFIKPKHHPKLGQVNELTFILPHYTTYFNFVEVGKPFHLMQIENPYFKLVREKYFLKVEWLGKTEWYIIDDIRKTGSSDGNYKEVTAYSLPYELSGDRVFGWAGVYVDGEYRKISLNINQITANILEGTLWNIKHIDTELLTTYRAFDFKEETKLECLYKIANAFNAIIEFDTENREISFYHQDNYGKSQGLSFSYARYLKTIQDEVKPKDIITRLIPVGKDGIQINSKNPTGTPYLQDFSYWMQPFDRDENGNVTQSSYWLSDGLCNALVDYNIKVQNLQPFFNGLIQQREDYLSQYLTKQAEISDKESEIRQIQDIIDIKQSSGEDASDELTQVQQLQDELAVLEDELQAIENNLETNQTSLENITNQLLLDNNLTQEQIEELTPFINTAVWNNDNLVTVEDLLEGAKEYFKKINHPKKAIEISIVDLFRIIDGRKDVKKLHLGDKINIHYEFLDIQVESQIIEMDIDYESGSINLVIANTKDVFKDDDERAIAHLYENVSVAGAALKDKYKWDKIEIIEGDVNEILQGKWDAAKREILAGVNQTVQINERGITIVDYNDPNRFIRIMNSVIGMTEDGGNTFKLAIDPTGVYAQQLVGRAIIGEKLSIGDEEGTFDITGNLLTIKDRQDIVRLLLGEYESDKFGLKLMNKTGQDVILDENGILQTWQEGRTDNVDSNNPLSIYVYLPNDTLSIRKAILRIKILPFRSYSSTTSSGGSSVQTSSSGGGTTATSSSGGGTTRSTSSGGGVSKSTANGGGTTRSTASFFVGENFITMEPAIETFANHWHRIPNNRIDHSHSFTVPSHSHSFEISNHTHDVTIPNHTHSVTINSHTHTVNIPAHTHGINHGIYTSTTANNVGVIINGVNRTSALGGSFNTDQSNLNIAPYLNIGQWNEIRLTSGRLGRLDASIFIQALMGTE